jgi:arylsulfatase A-like enzyme
MSHKRALLRFPLLLAVVLALTDDGSLANQAWCAERPNVLVILADDLGYADVGVHGCRDISTPSIDALAARGVRFTNGYASHPFCSPMRAGFISGRYQHRFGYVTNVAYDPHNTLLGLPIDVPTIAQRLKDAGYATGMAGKWHLGSSHLHHPNARGFDDFYGFLGGGHDYFTVDMRRAMHENYRQPLQRNGTPLGLDGYLTDTISDHAVEFIVAHQDQPFFYYLAYNAPHTPLQAPEGVLQKFADIKNEKRRKYAAMVHQMDTGIGRVVDALEDAGVLDQTLVFFLSDNGGPSFANASSNKPLRGNKGDVYEGGIRVPFIASWPDRLPHGAIYEQPVISFDISCTALAVAMAERTDQDEGVNLIPFLTGASEGTPHSSLFFRKEGGEAWAVRSGKWKLVVQAGGNERELYNLEADIGESHNILETHREVAERLAAAHHDWNAGNQPARFPGYRTYHQLLGEFYETLASEPTASVQP